MDNNSLRNLTMIRNFVFVLAFLIPAFLYRIAALSLPATVSQDIVVLAVIAFPGMILLGIVLSSVLFSIQHDDHNE